MPGSALTNDGLPKQACGHVRLARGEPLLLKREWMLADLLDTGVPTAESIAHLAALRRAVERTQHRKGGP